MVFYYVNGLVFPEGYRAIAFKRASEDRIYVTENILQIRYKTPLSSYIFNNVIVPNVNSLPITTGYGIYDNDYPTEEGYFWVRERKTTINGITFTSFSLKQRFGIVSLRFSSKYQIEPNSYGAGTKAIAFANEDYLLIFMEHNAAVTDFLTALNNPLLPPTVFSGSSITNAPPIYTINDNNPSTFTTFLYIPDWRNESKTIADSFFIETRDYYHYYIDFADYLLVINQRLSDILGVPVKHKSEYLELQQQYPAFVVYAIEYQDKNELAIYRKIKPWDTHYWVSARVNYEFHTSDFLIYRGLINDFSWQEKITNNLASVLVYGPGTGPNTGAQGYCAAIKWSLPDVDWSVMHILDEVSSSRNYYNYQFEFSAEIFYFWIRPEKTGNIVELIRAVYAEPRRIDCETIRNIATNVVWQQSGIHIIPNPSHVTPYNVDTIT